MRRRHSLAACVVLAVAASSCGPGDTTTSERSGQVTSEPSTAAAKNGTGETRHDLPPLAKRFTAIGAPVSATWMSGRLGDDDVPGPSTYWIDAVVTLAPGEARALRARYAAKPATSTPAVVDALRSQLPKGPLLTSDALDEAFSTGGFAASAYVDVQADQVVVTAMGE